VGKVAIVMGSESDLEYMVGAKEILEEFGVEYEFLIASAHRTPDNVADFARNAQARGFNVIIAGAGWASHLAGAIAAQTTLPVIGVPIPSSPLGGMDALLSTVQMPSGIPVATVSLGKAGARNAAIFAVEILALQDPALQAKLADYRRRLAEKVEKANERIRRRGDA